ncbi:MAG: tyrosine--tRNA ligase [Candidatus Eisenbacteria bacterium]
MAIEKDIEKQLEIIRRGTEEIISEEGLRAKIERSLKTGKPLRVKQGFDPTAPDIHIGHAVGLRKLRDFQRLGHKVVLIVGNYTALVGDPSGRSKTRPRLTQEDVEANARTYLEQFSRIVDPDETEIHRNGEWFSEFSFVDTLNLTALSTVARILERDDFEKRYKAGEPISIHELIYPLMQAYDSVAIDADVELGGTEQKFNLLLGRQVQEHHGKEPQVAVTVPILEGISGTERMSKSLGNYIGIDEEPNQIFGKVMSIPDDLIVHYYRLATEAAEEEIKRIEDSLKAGSENPKDLKAGLASEIVRIYHGESRAKAARDEFERRFGSKRGTLDLEGVEKMVLEVEGDAIWIVNLLRDSGLVKSGGEARRKIAAGAVRIDGDRVTDPSHEVPFEAGKEMLIRLGREFRKIEIRRPNKA